MISIVLLVLRDGEEEEGRMQMESETCRVKINTGFTTETQRHRVENPFGLREDVDHARNGYAIALQEGVVLPGRSCFEERKVV
jgi:hypothetical protein